ncbi:MAG: hypothetical protein JSR37_01530 [Verrucomicrobia bacterium]|nr:hypothetical protein [Verrucomicrobiota bacterium]MBS0636630.1 hypothetical protein [Verrucomicrobiota bacterium]
MSLYIGPVVSFIAGGLTGYVAFGNCSDCCIPKRRVVSGISAVVSCGSTVLLLQLFRNSLPTFGALSASTLGAYFISKKLLSPSIKTGFLYKTLYAE